MITRRTFLATLAAIAVALAGCNAKRDDGSAPVAGANGVTTASGAPGASTPGAATVVDVRQAMASPQVTRHPLRFSDAATAGLRWRFTNGATGRHFYVEVTGGGIAFFDYNNDGLLDVFALQGGPVPGATGAELRFNTRNALYRNNGDGTFTDATAGSGLDKHTGYGQGVSAADYDNDGRSDLYLTSYGGNYLFRNKGQGAFSDVTKQARVVDTQAPNHPGERPLPLSSAWGDYDNDGYLDLFVCHYTRWLRASDRPCPNAKGAPAYCHPDAYEPSYCRLYHNNRDGTFSDVSEKAGLLKLPAKAMGAVWLDYDDDGWMDLFVTNDSMPNFLLRNNRNGTFSDKGIVSGLAYSEEGKTLAGMGIGVGDYSNDARRDLFVVNFKGEVKSVFHNLGNGLFENASARSGIAGTSLQYLGFGLECFDYDLDGWQDLVVGNGHVQDGLEPGEANSSSYAQSQQLFHNRRDGTFVEDLHSLGDLVKPRVTRGLAVGDYDNDGDVDVLMVSQAGPLQLFRNDGGNSNRWITLRLEGVRSNRDAVGARVTIETKQGRQTQWVKGGSSYCSQSDLRLTFGLSGEESIKSLEVRWPRGLRQKLGPLRGNRFYWLKEGSAPVPEPRRPAPRQ